MGGFVLLFVVGCQVCLATLCCNTGRVGTTGTVQEDGQRVHTDSQRRILVEKALTTLLQSARPVRFSTLTLNRLCLSIARDVPMVECTSTVGVDRNLRNLTVGNDEETSHYDLSETVRSKYYDAYSRIFQTRRC